MCTVFFWTPQTVRPPHRHLCGTENVHGPLAFHLALTANRHSRWADIRKLRGMVVQVKEKEFSDDLDCHVTQTQTLSTKFSFWELRQKTDLASCGAAVAPLPALHSKATATPYASRPLLLAISWSFALNITSLNGGFGAYIIVAWSLVCPGDKMATRTQETSKLSFFHNKKCPRTAVAKKVNEIKHMQISNHYYVSHDRVSMDAANR